MNERKLELQFQLENRKVENRFVITRLIIRCITVLLAIAMIMLGLVEIASRAPEQISAMALVISATKLHILLPWCIAGITGTAWWHERVGKKRAIKKASKYQKMVEAEDPNRTSSGLTATGDTPEDRDE